MRQLQGRQRRPLSWLLLLLALLGPVCQAVCLSPAAGHSGGHSGGQYDDAVASGSESVTAIAGHAPADGAVAERDCHGVAVPARDAPVRDAPGGDSGADHAGSGACCDDHPLAAGTDRSDRVEAPAAALLLARLDVFPIPHDPRPGHWIRRVAGSGPGFPPAIRLLTQRFLE